MAVQVAVPLCHSTMDRQRLHEWVLSRWMNEYAAWRLGWATDRARRNGDRRPRTTDRFNHALAINNAVGTGDPNDVIVVADADTFPDPATLQERVDYAQLGVWTCPERYVNLSARTTDMVLQAGTLADAVRVANAATDHEWDGTSSWAGVVVIRRDQFERAGGYDPRFTGWSADDIAFAMAVETLVGPVTRLGTVFHLWHDAPRQRTYDRPGFAASWTLTSRYMDAHGDADKIRAIINERSGDERRVHEHRRVDRGS